jgi:hypothetical protein
MAPLSKTTDGAQAAGAARGTESTAPVQVALIGGLRDFLIIIVALLGIVLVLILVLSNGRLTTASDIVAVLSVSVSSISTIAAAAFGVSVGTQAGSQAGQAVATETKKQAAAVKRLVLAQLDQVEGNYHPVEAGIRQLPMQNRTFSIVPGGATLNLQEPIAVPQEHLDRIRESLGAIRAAMTMLPE